MATNLDNCYFTIKADNKDITDLTEIKSNGIYNPTPTVTYNTTNSGKSTQPPGNFTVYQMEHQTIQFYNTFLTEYSNCFDNIKTPNDMDKLTSCPSAKTALIRAQNMQLILDSAIGKIPSNLTSGITQGKVDASYNYILSNYNNLVNTRSKLDQQMKDIQKTSDSVYSMYKGSYDSTMYSQILLTVLATSLIYYVFVKL
jgi:hypothetical protein